MPERIWTAYPEGGEWTFTRFYIPQAFDSGYRLVSDADTLWQGFEAAHHKADLAGRLAIPMESFARAVEIVLKESELRDSAGYCPEARSLSCGPMPCSTAATYSHAMQPGASSLLPLSAASARPLSFPILTLDERKLTPALGYVFSRKWLEPCESLVSILWKFERANGAPGHIVARLARPDIDPYEGIVPELGEVDINRLRENLLVPVGTFQMALLQPSQRRRYSNVFRHCRRCMAHGYHSVLHQMESIRACPAHHRALETECRRCGYEAPYRISVQLLESPYRCASCRASYGGQGWMPGTPLMKAEYRKAFTRRYFERHLG